MQLIPRLKRRQAASPETGRAQAGRAGGTKKRVAGAAPSREGTGGSGKVMPTIGLAANWGQRDNKPKLYLGVSKQQAQAGKVMAVT